MKDSPVRAKSWGWARLLPPGAVLLLLLLGHSALALVLARAGPSTYTAIRLVDSAAWLAGIWLAVRLINLLLWERLVPWWAGVRAPGLLRQFVALLLAAGGVALMLSRVWGVALAAVLATTGVLGIVFGLALRNILADFFSGIALNIERPFGLGDFVMLRVRGQREPIAGTVREVNWRSTRVLTPEDNLISVPNSVVAAAVVENLSYPSPVSELELDIALDWELDQALVERVLTAAVTEAWALGATAGETPPKVRICRLDGTGVTWRVVYLLDPRKRAKGPARHTLLTCMHRHLLLAGLRPAAPSGTAPVPVAMAQAPRDHDRVADRERTLAQVTLLRGLTQAERRRLAGDLRVQALGAGQPVVRSGEPGASMFVVASGALEVQVPGVDPARRANVLGPGSVFGEMSMLTGETRSSTVRALSDSVLYEVDRALMAPLMAARPELADVLSREVVRHQQRDMAAAEAARAQATGAAPALSMSAQLAVRIRAFFSD